MPSELAVQLHEALRRHFRGDPSVEVVVEQRRRDRRRVGDRRAGEADGDAAAVATAERRRIHNLEGRRVADRRASVIEAGGAAELPRKARPYADRLVFVERLEPSSEREEDFDTARLVTRIQAGESDLFATLYMRYFDRVYAYLRVVVRDPHGAEDVTQQVFMKVFESLPRYQRRGQPFRAWLFIIVRNHAINHLREQNRLDPVDPVEIVSQRDAVEPEEMDLSALNWISDRDLVVFIERLPLAQRQVLVLRYLLDLSASEVATILGRTRTDVSTLQYRALRFLEARLAAVGRTPHKRGLTRMRRWGTPASVLRTRRFALLRS